jgi:hypothetical protein
VQRGRRWNGYMPNWSQKTAFPQMQLEKDILDGAQNDWIARKTMQISTELDQDGLSTYT